MKRRLRVLTMVGTRPETIKLAPVVRALHAAPARFETVLCSTGQHREMLEQVLADFELELDYDLNLMIAGQTLSGLTAAVMTATSSLLAEVAPDVVLVQGDTTSAMVAALAAYYARIPIGHVEAGLRTGDPDNPFPEEVNRRLISVLASWHYAPTQTAVEALLREGVPEDRVVLTGNTVVDALLWMSERVGPVDDDARTILVTAHRRESFGAPFEQLCMALRDISLRNSDIRIVFPVHLNPNVRRPVMRILSGLPRVELIEPLPYREFTRMLKGAHLVLTDSGGIQEEAPVFGKPVLVMRSVTERPEAVSAGTVRIVGTSRSQIVKQAERLLKDTRSYKRMSRAISPYGDGRAADRIVQHLTGLASELRSRARRVVRVSTTT